MVKRSDILRDVGHAVKWKLIGLSLRVALGGLNDPFNIFYSVFRVYSF